MALTNCYISSGLELSCHDSLGSLKNVWILGGSGYTVNDVAVDASDAITGMTGNGNFYKFELKRNTSGLVQTVNASFENGSLYYTQELTMVFNKLDIEKRAIIKVLATNPNLKVIVQDQNDTFHYCGETNGMFLASGDASTGVAVGDRSGYSLVLSSEEKNMARIFDVSTIADLDTLVSAGGFTLDA